MKSIFPYYGGKFNQLKDIFQILEQNLEKFDLIVDVFGGSGKLLINVPKEWRKIKVYNDVNEELYVTFKVLQNPRKRAELRRKLRYAFPHEKIFQEMKRSHPRSDVERAFRIFYIHTFSFSSDGSSFARVYKGRRFKRFQLDNFLLAEDWVVENMDFRELMKRYNKPRVLLYLDPPYLRSGKKYNYTFSLQDFEDLKKAIEVHQGTYLMNLSLYDNEMKEIFGEPDKVVDYVNPVRKGEKKQSWGCGYWAKFS